MDLTSFFIVLLAYSNQNAMDIEHNLKSEFASWRQKIKKVKLNKNSDMFFYYFFVGVTKFYVFRCFQVLDNK